MRRALFAAVLLLAGCAHASLSTAVCVAVRPYTAAELDAVDQAQALLPPDSPLIGVLQDWIRMRDDGRACVSAKP